MARKAGRIVFGLYLAVVHLALVYFLVDRIAPNAISFYRTPVADVSAPTVPGDAPIANLTEETPPPLPLPSVTAAPTHETSNLTGDELLVPVVGVKREQLIDTFATARSGGRVHDAIDIPAPVGTPVVAAQDGQIVKFWESVAGGTTIYQVTADKRYVLYYAHLQSRAPEIKEGDQIKRGTTIGFVGDTGNAGAGNYHLHFSIALIDDPKHYWTGTYINPYPLLRNPSKLP